MIEVTMESEEYLAALSLFAREREPKPRALETVTWCAANGARILYPGHEDYPFDTSRLGYAPPFLSCLGGTPWKNARCISIVGSREPSRNALTWMETYLPEFIRESRAVVVSGGARGIDQKAHALALRAGRPTVVFVPSGLGRMYPSEWSEWKNEVLGAGGSILSTYAPLQEIRRSHFEERNRLITVLGKLLFVVEARRRSGSLMTARMAREIDRTLCVLPAFPGDPRAAGTVDLLFEGALPIRDAHDLSVLFAMSAC